MARNVTVSKLSQPGDKYILVTANTDEWNNGDTANSAVNSLYRLIKHFIARTESIMESINNVARPISKE